MKKFFKYLLIALGAILLLVGAVAAFIQIRGVPSYDPPSKEIAAFKVEYTPERLAHGRKLASMLCAGCHLDQNTGRLTGIHMADAPEEFGIIRSRNITQHPARGIGSWTDGELVYLLRTGITRDGEFIAVMGGFPRMSDEDIYSIVTFLRSNDPMVAATDVPNTPSEYTFLAKALANFGVFSPKAFPEKPIAAPPITDKVAYGKYLALGVVDCFGCHSADFKTVNTNVPEQSEGFFGGGNPLLDVNGKPIFSSNITPDPETGIGNWTEAQFIRAVRDGFRPDNTPLRYPMSRYHELRDEEIGAIYAYLRTIPAIKHKVPQSHEYKVVQASTNEPAMSGKQIYYKYACYSCHGEDGKGNCDLRDAHTKYTDNETLVAWIRNPSAINPDTKMPTWEGVIQENEYAPLAQYVRDLGMKKNEPRVAER